MKFSVALAICVSIVIVGFASWYRYSAPQTTKNVATLEPVATDNTYNDELLRSFLEPNKESSNALAKPAELEENLTNTDIVSRNLILSYLDLAANNQVANTQTIQDLAAQYVNSITNYHQFTKILIQDIKVVPDSAVNAQKYAEEFAEVYADLNAQIESAATNTVGLTEFNDSYKQTVESYLTIYDGIATGLKDLQVPVSLSQLHLELINIYLSNAQAMRSSRNLEADPITAIAGLTALKESAARETEIFKTMKKILQDKWGII